MKLKMKMKTFRAFWRKERDIVLCAEPQTRKSGSGSKKLPIGLKIPIKINPIQLLFSAIFSSMSSLLLIVAHCKLQPATIG